MEETMKFVPKLTTTDWNIEWEALQKAKHHADNADFWNERSQTFHKPLKVNSYVTDFIKYAQVQPGDTVMDMGCGTGAITVPLAKASHHVVAADFSRGMLDMLEGELAKIPDANVSIKCFSWADEWAAYGVAPKSVDVACASRSIATDDLKDALQKLSAVAKRRCAVTMTTGASPRADESILQAIGIQRYIGRDYLYAVMILVAMGYFPEVRYIPSERLDSFANEEEAFTSLKKMVVDAAGRYVAEGEVEEALANLKKWLAANLVPNPSAGQVDAYGEVEKALCLKKPRKITWAHIAWNV